jgi:hypothetical protein
MRKRVKLAEDVLACPSGALSSICNREEACCWLVISQNPNISRLSCGIGRTFLSFFQVVPAPENHLCSPSWDAVASRSTRNWAPSRQGAALYRRRCGAVGKREPVRRAHDFPTHSTYGGCPPAATGYRSSTAVLSIKLAAWNIELLDPRTLPTERFLERLGPIEETVQGKGNQLQTVVDLLRSRQVSWAQIGAALGISRQSAWERFT